MRFSLRAIFVVIAIAGIALGWLTWTRGRNSDRLAQAIQSMGETKIAAKYASETLLENPWLAKVTGDTSERPQELRLFKVPKHFGEMLKRSRATDQITELSFVRYVDGNHFFSGHTRFGDQTEPILQKRKLKPDEASIAEDCPMFFAKWPKLERIMFRDTKIPENWRKQMGSLSQVKEIVISGGNCNLKPEDLASISSLESLVLAHQGVTRSRLEDLELLMPKTDIWLCGSFDSKHEFKIGEGLSEHDPVLYQKMKTLISQINEAIKAAGGDNIAANPPATEAEIAELEQTISVPLPPSLRAFYEVTNGWQNAPIFGWVGIRSTQETASDFRGRTHYAYRPDQYNFDGRFDQWANPNAIPINSHYGFNLSNDRLNSLDPGGESGPSALSVELDMFSLLEALQLELKDPKKSAKSKEGKVKIWGSFWYR